MVSFILIAKDKTKRLKHIQTHAKKHAIDAFDITLVEKDATKKNLQSIGIEDIKTVQKKIFLKPLKSTTKLIVIEDAHLLTTEAQNALLKVLEEPPAHTHIILATETKEALLATILSRCQIIELEEEKATLSEETVNEFIDFIETLPTLTIVERLHQAEQLAKDKEKAILWIENLTLILRKKIINKYTLEALDTFDTPDTLETLHKLQSLRTILKTTNVNPRFAIEHTLLKI